MQDITFDQARAYIRNLEHFRHLRKWSLQTYIHVANISVMRLKNNDYYGPGSDFLIKLFAEKIMELTPPSPAPLAVFKKPTLILKKLRKDDELLEPEKPPAPVFLTIRELPIPDAYYVAQTVAPALHPLIAKKCKKDCRTWLWKSSRQREARLAQQEEDERNAGSDMIEKMDSGSSGGRGPTAPSSKNEVADSAYPGLGFDLNRMNLG